MEEIEWIKISKCPSLKSVQIDALLDLCVKPCNRISHDIESIMSRGFSSEQAKYLVNPPNVVIKGAAEWLTEHGAHVISIVDERYPSLLKEIASPPLVLYVLGDVDVLQKTQIAIVGSRKPTPYGRAQTSKIASELSNHAVITSGLAYGVDAVSHEAALGANGETIAVLGSGFANLYPKSHHHLANRIIKSGAVISEFLPNEPPRKHHFPRRNRIISGMANGVLVTEAAIKSGSLVTANYCAEQGRDVFAVPGNVLSPLSEGPHYLIQQGAKLVTSAADIVEEYELVSLSELPTSDEKNNLADNHLLASVDHDITPVDVIIQRSGLPTEQALIELFDLEVQGFVSAVPGGFIKVV
jgi:DNA processing protein